MTPDLPTVEIAIVKQTNIFRRQNALNAVRRNRLLDLAARRFAQYLARTGKFSHTADGRKPAERISATGYEYCRISENLALRGDSRGFKARVLAKSSVEGWKKSPGHRRNMMEPSVTEIGVGVAKAPGKHQYLSVQLFGRPRALRYTFEIRNTTQQRVGYSFAGRQRTVPARVVLKTTACEPGKLQFSRSVGLAAQPNRAARFTTGRGDRFILSVRNGKIVVSRRRGRD